MAGGTPHADVYAARLGDSSLGLFCAANDENRCAVANEMENRCQTQASDSRRASGFNRRIHPCAYGIHEISSKAYARVFHDT